jgi:hypothetical protein
VQRSRLARFPQVVRVGRPVVTGQQAYVPVVNTDMRERLGAYRLNTEPPMKPMEVKKELPVVIGEPLLLLFFLYLYSALSSCEL